MPSPFDWERIRRLAGPDVALIVMVDKAGKVLEAYVADIPEAVNLMQCASEAQFERKPPALGETHPEEDSSAEWWSPTDGTGD